MASDLELIALVPRPSWTAPEVDATLQKAVAEAGVPRVIVDDHGGDLTGGVQLFQERHPETLEVDDIGHKAACVLERRLESDPRWPEFHWQVGQTRCAIQQTELAFLVPPGPRPKARFMNLEPLLAWGRKVVGILKATISGGVGLGERGAVARETRLAVGPARRLGRVVAVASGSGFRDLPGA